MWVEFVVGFRPCLEGFSPGSSVFRLPQKSIPLNSNSIWKQRMKSHIEMSLLIVIIIIIIIIIIIYNINMNMNMIMIMIIIMISIISELNKEFPAI